MEMGPCPAPLISRRKPAPRLPQGNIQKPAREKFLGSPWVALSEPPLAYAATMRQTVEFAPYMPG